MGQAATIAKLETELQFDHGVIDDSIVVRSANETSRCENGTEICIATHRRGDRSVQWGDFQFINNFNIRVD